MTELVVLQSVRLKGRVRRDDLHSDLVDELIESGYLVDGTMLRLTEEGRIHLGELLATERSGIDASAIAAAYDEFRSLNYEFKALVTDWQVKDNQPNAHDDPLYDAAVLERLDAVHRRVAPVLAAVTAELPRLGEYAKRLAAALDQIHAGEIFWLTRPLIDSYHTVWFELHEELILAAGLTREAEDA